MCVILSHCNRWLGYDTGMKIRFFSTSSSPPPSLQTLAMQLGTVINSPIQRVPSLRTSLTIAKDVSFLTCERTWRLYS